MSESPTASSNKVETTLLIVNLVLTFISTVILGLKIRMKCCCGELAMKGKDNNSPDSPLAPSTSGAAAAALPKAISGPVASQTKRESVHIKTGKDGSISIINPEGVPIEIDPSTPAKKSAIVDVVDAEDSREKNKTS